MDAVRIPLTYGKFAVIDADDEPLVSGFRWRAHERFGIWYAIANVARDGRRSLIQMHRLITDAPVGVYVDHRNGDGLDNRRSNLRHCSNSQNQQNRHQLTTNTSGYRGVTWNRASNKWQAAIKHQQESHYLGLYEHLEDAARAYDAAARELFGDFMRPNFPNDIVILEES